MVKKVLLITAGLLAVCSLTADGLMFDFAASAASASPTPIAEEKNPRANSDPIYTQLRAVRLSGDFASVENIALKRDTATITLKQGELHLLAPVEGRITGAVFIGQGEFQMTPTLPMEQRHLSILTGAQSIEDQFSKMVLRFTDSTYEEIKKQSDIKKGAPNSTAQNALDDIRKMLRRGKTFSHPNVATGFFQYNLDARILIDLTWPGQQGLFHAYFDGKRYGSTLYAIDPLGAPFITPEEVALVNFTDGSLGIWTASHLKDHYRNESAHDEDHRLIDLEHYKIEATAKGKRLDAIA